MAGSIGLFLACAAPLAAQGPTHLLQRMDSSPPGQIGQQRLANPRLRGYVQPVELHGPEGSFVSIALGEAFSPSQRERLKAGLTVGHVYMFKIGGVPQMEEFEVFPSVEIIDRLHPPAGLALKFPIPVHVTREEIEAASVGRFITRVVYVEDPRRAVPERQLPSDQPYIEVLPHEDPLAVADRIGRPVAILRMGSRVPDPTTIQQLSAASPLPILFSPEDELPEFSPLEESSEPLLWNPSAQARPQARVVPATHAPGAQSATSAAEHVVTQPASRGAAATTPKSMGARARLDSPAPSSNSTSGRAAPPPLRNPPSPRNGQ